MSCQGSTSNLTSKFSRSSLKKATGHSSSRVHSREEELARATNKRFNSESWRNLTRNYRTFPTAADSSIARHNNNFSNHQIICALSSLTEDLAFQTGSSDIPMLPRSASYAGSGYSTARDSAFRRQQMIYNSPSQGSAHSVVTPATPTNSTKRTATTAASSTAPSVYDDEEENENDDFEDCQSDLPKSPISSPRVVTPPDRVHPSQASRTSLRSAAGRVPKLNRKLGQALPSNSIRRAMEREGGAKSLSDKRVEYQKLRPNKNGMLKSLQSIVSAAVNFFKLLHCLLLLPETIKKYLTKPRWSGKGKCVLITGASSGIGAEIARQYAAQGAFLALVSRTSQDLDRVAQECRELGSSKALFYAADLANPVSIKLAMKQALKDFGKFDVVVLNAGRSQGCYFEEIKDPSQIETMIKLNINGAITCLHYILPQIPKNSDSRIVVMSNTTGIVAAPYQSVYSATKHALTGFANSLRIELKNTYGNESPKICLVSFPEVAGTRCNTGRMDMGAKLPPAKWYSWAGIPLPHAVRDLLPAIALGRREFGQPAKFNMWRSLYAICPGWVDVWMMKYIQKTHYRPLDERTDPTSKNKTTTPSNKSWAN